MASSKTMIAVVLGTAAVLAAAAGIAAASETTTYSYDAKGRLVRAAHSGTINTNVVANYSFDDADNRKTMNVTGAP